ncbi:hypothetical protein AVEN_269031-1 [Araneus ventricosus]|uniref:Uncharacterized protein n=1 Tax=Araneus ventricosus TaxID=182803 RepID=A0A4Y2MNL6_ARAVE|nr:hypothetical protein AVEN_269031-1 [Araneus ventricosus]
MPNLNPTHYRTIGVAKRAPVFRGVAKRAPVFRGVAKRALVFRGVEKGANQPNPRLPAYLIGCKTQQGQPGKESQPQPPEPSATKQHLFPKQKKIQKRQTGR